jgi:hypothetical protein
MVANWNKNPLSYQHHRIITTVAKLKVIDGFNKEKNSQDLKLLEGKQFFAIYLCGDGTYDWFSSNMSEEDAYFYLQRTLHRLNLEMDE